MGWDGNDLAGVAWLVEAGRLLGQMVFPVAVEVAGVCPGGPPDSGTAPGHAGGTRARLRRDDVAAHPPKACRIR